MPRLTQRLTPGCTTAMLDTDSTHTVTGIMVMVWDIMDIIWVMLPIMVTLTIMAIMERGAPRLSQLPRLIPGCTTAMLDTDSTHTDMVIMVMVWVMLPML